MELALEAIRGQQSAHSLATGPVIADPAKQNFMLLDNRKNVNNKTVRPILTFVIRVES